MTAKTREPVARCGTVSGFNKHKREGVRPCPACVAVKQEYDKRWNGQPERVKKSRASARAQGRAYSRLAAIYPDLYHALYAEEKDRAYREAGLQPEAVREW